MSGTSIRPVVIKQDQERSFRERLDQMQGQIGKRAFELYRARVGRQAADFDWTQAEREVHLSHLAGVEDNGQEFRIVARCPNCSAGDLSVDVLSDAVVVESKAARERSVRPFSVFRLPGRINPNGVRVEFHQGELVIMAPKI